MLWASAQVQTLTLLLFPGIVKVMNQNLRKDYIWNSIGIVLQSLISPLLLIVVTRINGIDQSGMFSFAFSVSIIFLTFGLWGGRTYQVSDIKRRFSNKSYVLVRLLLAVAMLVGSIVFVVLNGYDITKSLLLIGLVLMKASESIADAYYGVLQTNGKLYKTGISLTLKTMIGFALFTVVNVLTSTMLLSTVALIVAYILVLFVYDIPSASKFGRLTVASGELLKHLRESRSILNVCFPVFIIAFLSAFALNVPRYFIDVYHNQDLGYYGIIAMPITLIALFISFVLQPNIVRLSELYDDNKGRATYGAQVLGILFYVVGAGLAILVGTAIIGVPVLSIIFGKDFSPYYVALMLIVAGGIISALVAVFVNMLIVMRSFKAPMYVLLLTDILLVSGSYYLIPNYGINMAALLFLLVCCAQLLCIAVLYMGVIKRRYA